MRRSQLVLLAVLALVACLGGTNQRTAATASMRTTRAASVTTQTYIPLVVNGSSGSTPTPIPPSPTPAPAPKTVRIDAGSAVDYTDHAGNVWLADSRFVTGGNSVDRGAIRIGQTYDPTLYRSEQYGMNEYSVPDLANGMYLVRLHFAETVFNGRNARVFNVRVQNSVVISNLDVWAEAGGKNIALVKSVLVQVSNRRLFINFSPIKENAEINAIEIIPSNAIRIDAGSYTSYVDSAGNEWHRDSNTSSGTISYYDSVDIPNSDDDQLYKTERYGMTEYRFPVLNRNYTVKLHFAETFPNITAPGMRVFDLDVEGRLVTNLDVFAEAGGQYRALVKTFDVNVFDGDLTIKFTRQIENPQINAIEIIHKQ